MSERHVKKILFYSELYVWRNNADEPSEICSVDKGSPICSICEIDSWATDSVIGYYDVHRNFPENYVIRTLARAT